MTIRTVERWAAALQDSGPAGIADGRSQRAADPLGGVDERWLAMCRLVLAEHTGASRPTQALVLHRVSARLAAGHGDGTVPEPGRRRARAVLAELSRGTNAFTGSTKGKRSIAARPQGVYGRLRPTRPGEYLLLDTTPLDVFAMEPVTLRWVRCELTIAMDLYSRAIIGLRLSPVSTKSVDAALVLFEALRPGSRQHTSGGLLPYAGLPDLVVAGDGTAGLAGVAAETVVVDHGKIYLSDHLLSVCQRLGISLQPARPLTPTDKAAVERFFRTLSEGLLAALPGYKGSDVYSRGADPEGCAYFFTGELEQVVREWIERIYHRRSPAGLADPDVPGLELSPAEMLAQGTARAGRLKIPAHPGMVFDFLPVAWRTIQHYGVEVGGLRYNGLALTRYRNQTSPYTGEHAGKWPVGYDTDDVSRAWFQDPADNAWHELAWEHAREVAVPFSADTLAYSRRLALAQGRHVDGGGRWPGCGPVGRRWSSSLPSGGWLSRVAAAGRPAGRRPGRGRGDRGPAVGRRLTGAHETPGPDGPAAGGDDDSPGELDTRATTITPTRSRCCPVTSAGQFTVEERDWNPSVRSGWFAMAEAPPRAQPPLLAAGEMTATLPAAERRRYDQARAVWHANLGPIRTPQVDAVFDALEEICGSNRQDGDKVRPAAVLDALPGLGKTTAALAFGRWFHREQIDQHGSAGEGRRRDVAAHPGRLPRPDLAHHDAEPERDALPVLRAARARQRRRARPPRRRVRDELQDPAGHRGRRALPGHFAPRRT